MRLPHSRYDREFSPRCVCFVVGISGGENDTENSGTKTTQAKTPAELEADQLTLQQLRRQEDTAQKTQPLIDQYIADYTANQEARKAAGITPEAQAKADVEAQQRAQRMGGIEEQLANLQLEAIKQGGKATPEQIAQIDAATGAAQKTGEADIERFRTSTLRQINEEVASASGLRPTDTPIVRLSERAGEEAARQQGILTSTLAGANANARLNFPLAAGNFTSAAATAQQNLAESASQFSQQLQMRAQDNRFRLFSGNSALNINPVSFGSSLGGQRAQNYSTFGNEEKSRIGVSGGYGS